MFFSFAFLFVDTKITQSSTTVQVMSSEMSSTPVHNCSRCIELKKLNDESEINCQRLFMRLKTYEMDISQIHNQNLKINEQKEKSFHKFQSLLSSLSVTQQDSLNWHADLANVIEFTRQLFEEYQAKTLDDNMKASLNKLLAKLKTDSNNNNTVSSNNQTVSAKSPHQNLLEKEITLLKAKLRQTRYELDAFKLKLTWNTSTQTCESYSSPGSQTSTFFGSPHMTSPTITSNTSGGSSSQAVTSTISTTNSTVSTNSSLSVSSLVLSNETGVGSSASTNHNNNNNNNNHNHNHHHHQVASLNQNIDLLNKLHVDSLKQKIKEQNEMIRELIKSANVNFEGESCFFLFCSL